MPYRKKERKSSFDESGKKVAFMQKKKKEAEGLKTLREEKSVAFKNCRKEKYLTRRQMVGDGERERKRERERKKKRTSEKEKEFLASFSFYA